MNRATSPSTVDEDTSLDLTSNHAGDFQPRPQSFISSLMTDIISEDGDGTTGQPATRSVQSTTGPPGEPGLPPSRPSSISTARSANRRWSQAPPSRRGGVLTTIGPSSVTGSTGGTSMRPTTSASKTHVPSLTSHAFFRPMSSQRLQAQRGQRPLSLVGQSSINQEGRGSDTGSNYHRQSATSIQQNRGLVTIGLHHDAQDTERPPPSRGTDFTERDVPDRTTANSTPTGAETVRSRGESVTPLRKPTKPMHLDLAATYKSNSTTKVPTPTKSPRSFRSSFIMPSRNGGSAGAMRSQGLEKLSSTSSSPRLARQEDSTKVAQEDLGRNYEYFTGNTVFCWGGRLQNTRERPINIATGIMVIAPAVLFLVFSAPWIWSNITPAIPILFGYVFLICISSFVHASVSDPGILPRNLHSFPPPSPNEDPLTIGPPTTEWTMVVSAVSKSQAMEVPTKYCKSCNIWRPPRAHHCRVCDNCIETQDHHCVWLNNCVGRRNYRYFFTFVSSCTILGLLLLGASLAHILVWRTRNGASFGHAISELRVPFAMLVYGAIVTPYPASLWGYHIFLIARGETTREYLNSHKFLKNDRHRPFTQGSGIAGWVRNWVSVLTRPRPPTYLHLKREYVAGDQRFGLRKGQRTDTLKESDTSGGMGVEMVNVNNSAGGVQDSPRKTN